MKKFLLSILVILSISSCCKKDEEKTTSYRDEEALYAINIVTNGEPLTGAKLSYFITHKDGNKGSKTEDILWNLSKQPTFSLELIGSIKGEINVSLVASSSSDKAKATLQLLRGGKVIKEETKEGKMLTLSVGN